MHGIFVTGTSTGVGKTVISAALLAAAPTESSSYWKPAQTGFPADDDLARVAELSGREADDLLQDGIRLAEPASPHHAAALEGVALNLADTLSMGPTQGDERFWVVEGAGGWHVPLSDTALISDLALSLRLPVLVVATTELGTINHTLLTLESIRAAGLQPVGVVLNGPRCESAESALAAHAAVPVILAETMGDLNDRSRLQELGARIIETCELQSPNLTSESQVLEWDASHVWHPFTQQKTAPAPLVVTGAKGAYLELSDGRQVLDAISSWWAILHGHCEPTIMEAIRRQTSEIDHVILAGVTHGPAAEMSAALARITPGDLDHVFFSDDGSTAVEVGLKMAVQYWRLHNNPQKTKFVALRGGYHGDTVGAMSVGDPTDFHEEFEAITFATTRVETAEELDAHLKAHGHETAAFIFEPIVQGAAGMRMWDPKLIATMAAVARSHEVLLIADEVMCGFGRTGPLFACELANLIPDIMCLSKGLTGGVLPLGATVVREPIYTAFLHDDKKKAFLHGHTFSGNPIACAAAIASMKLLDDPELTANRHAIEEFYAATLPTFLELPSVRTVRHRGIIGVVELESEEVGYFNSRTPAIGRAMLEEGYLVRPLGNVIYTLLPFRTPIAALRDLYGVLRDQLSVNV